MKLVKQGDVPNDPYDFDWMGYRSNEGKCKQLNRRKVRNLLRWKITRDEMHKVNGKMKARLA